MSHESPYIRHFFIDDTLVSPSSEGVLILLSQFSNMWLVSSSVRPYHLLKFFIICFSNFKLNSSMVICFKIKIESKVL